MCFVLLSDFVFNVFVLVTFYRLLWVCSSAADLLRLVRPVCGPETSDCTETLNPVNRQQVQFGFFTLSLALQGLDAA